MSWRSAFSPTETLQRVRPKEFTGDLLNPHIGTTTFQRFNGDPVNQENTWDDTNGPEKFSAFDPAAKHVRFPNTTISYCRWIWSRIEPEKGKFNWQFIDGALDAAEKHGQTLQARIQPFIGDDIPKWYWQSGATRDKTQKQDYHPCHNDPNYLKHWGEFIAIFGKRYDGNPALESFDIAYGGACGEMGGDASPETAAKLVDIYVKAFPKTQLISMLGTPGCAYAAKLKDKNIGWRADCYGDLRTVGRGNVPDHLGWNHTYDAYPREVAENGVTEAWKHSPVTLETCWTVGQWHVNGWDIDMILAEGLKYHTSVFMPKSAYFPEEWWNKLMKWNRRLGYRFVLRQLRMPLEAKAGAKIPLEFWIDNVGVAPIYRPYQVALRFRGAGKEEIIPLKRDIRTLMPENTWFAEEMNLPASLQRGTHSVDIGIIDPVTKKAKVKFSCEGTDAEGWLALSYMDIA